MNGRPFNVTLTEQSDAVLVAVFGDVDIVTTPVLQRHLDAAVSSGRATVVIDLSETTSLDARGVAVLVGARKVITRAGGHLVIRRPQSIVRRVLELAEQVDRIPIED